MAKIVLSIRYNAITTNYDVIASSIIIYYLKEMYYYYKVTQLHECWNEHFKK